MAPESERLVTYSEDASSDLAAVYEYTLHQHGFEQAEAYAEFLLRKAREAAEGHLTGKRLADFPTLCYVTARWPSAFHGHNIIFAQDASGIRVLRILHTAMDPQKHLAVD